MFDFHDVTRILTPDIIPNYYYRIHNYIHFSLADCEATMYVKDIKRMGFNTQTIWRTTEINSKFE